MKLEIKKGLALIALSIISYILIYFIPFIFNLPKWSFTSLAIFDYSQFFLPILGFYFMLLGVHYIDIHFKEKISSKPYFIIIFIAFCLTAFWLAVFMFARNSYDLGADASVVQFDFFAQLVNNSFFGFMLGGIAGWLSKYFVDFLLDKKQTKKE